MKSARRRILQGSAAVPVLFTMRTASATALGSAVACMKKDAVRAESPPKPPEIYKLNNDGWVRVRLDLCELSVYQGNKPVTLDGRYFLGVDNTTYWKLVEQYGASDTAVMSPYTVNSCSARRLGEFRYALAYVDNLGNRVGYALQKNGGQAITGSCWASIRPGSA